MKSSSGDTDYRDEKETQSQLQVESGLAWIREQMKAREFAWQSTAIGALEVQAPADPTLLPK